MTRRFEGKVALITGGASGIGAATAQLMAQEGAKVVVGDLHKDGAQLASSFGAEFTILDVSDEVRWKAVVSEMDERHGGIDILVNSAGIEGDQRNNSIISTTLSDWRRVHAVNLDGTFLGCQTIIPIMTRKKAGSIVNLSSIASYFPSPFNCAYGSSKAAVQHLTKSVAAWGARDGNRIRCNSVHPGLVGTRMLFNIVGQRAGRPQDGLEIAQKIAADTLPLRELITPEEIAKMILYLASDDAINVTGCEFVVDGGWNLTHGMMLNRR